MTGCNYHTHTVYCDGSDTPEELVKQAIALGCAEIGFSGHSFTDIPDDDPFCMSPENTAAYIAEVTRLKKVYVGQIRILLGIEQDFYSEEPTEAYDYVIGSVHYVLKDGYYIPVDETAEIQVNAVKKYYNGDFYAFCEDYYALVGELADKTGCDIVGHFDIIAKFNEGNRLFDTSDLRYIAAADRALRKLLDKNVAFEINYGGVAKGYRTEPYPENRIAEKIKTAGGRIIYSSDCHKKELLLFGIPEGNRI